MPGSVERRRATRMVLAAAATLGVGVLLAAVFLVGAEERGALGVPLVGSPPAADAAVPAGLEGPAHEPVASAAAAQRVPVGAENVSEGGRVIAAPLRGRLVDEQTDRAVPRYLIELRAGSADEVQAITDEQGRFETPVSMPLGQISVWLSESGDRHTLHHRVEQGVAAEHRLSIRTGPTFFLALEAPEAIAVEEMAVILLDRAPIPRWPALEGLGGSGWFKPGVDLPSWVFHHGSPWGEEADLRTDGDPAWVRFPPLEEGHWPLPEPEGYALLVADEAMAWAGIGHATSLVGVHGGRIPVRFERLCALEGSVSFEGAMVPYAVVNLRGAGLPRPLGCVTDERGRFGFAAPAGRFELDVESSRGTLEAQPVDLAEEKVRLDLRLQPLATIEVGGIIRSRTGTLWESPPLLLRSHADPGLGFLGRVKPSRRAGEITGRFRFDRVPPGSYELVAEPYAGVACEPSRIEVGGPAADLELLCRDDFDRTELGFALRAADGGPLRSSNVVVWIDGERRLLGRASPSGPPTTLITLPARASARWLAWASGCVPSEGLWRGSGAKEERVEVSLERGPGLAVLVVDPSSYGVGGAEILIDGTSAGRTNEFGYSAPAVQEEPRSVRVRKEGQTCLLSAIDIEDGVAFFMLDLLR